MFAEGRVLADFQRSSGAGRVGRSHHLCSTPPWGRAEMHLGISTALRAVYFGICLFSPRWPEWLFFCSKGSHLVRGGMRRWAASPGVLGGLMVLESPHSVWPLAGHSSFHSVSIKCMTHLSDAKKLKRLGVPVIKGTI